MSATRKEVLKCFKNLHLARQLVFEGDENAMTSARHKINDEFKKNKTLTNQDEIKKLITLATEVETELRTNVVQAVETRTGVFRAKITEKTKKLDNVLFDENADIPPPRSKRCT